MFALFMLQTSQAPAGDQCEPVFRFIFLATKNFVTLKKIFILTLPID